MNWILFLWIFAGVIFTIIIGILVDKATSKLSATLVMGILLAAIAASAASYAVNQEENQAKAIVAAPRPTGIAASTAHTASSTRSKSAKHRSRPTPLQTKSTVTRVIPSAAAVTPAQSPLKVALTQGPSAVNSKTGCSLENGCFYLDWNLEGNWNSNSHSVRCYENGYLMDGTPYATTKSSDETVCWGSVGNDYYVVVDGIKSPTIELHGT